MSAGRELARAAAILAVASAAGLLSNALSARPVPLLARDGPGAWPDRAPRITAEELRAALGGGRPILLLDVRSRESYDTGHAPRSIHAPSTTFLESYGRLGLASVLKAAEQVVVLCESDQCSSGDRVARMLRDLGHEGVVVLQGGWGAYCSSGMEATGP